MAVLVVIARSGHLDLDVLGRLFYTPTSAFLLLGIAVVNLFFLTMRWWVIVNDTLKPYSLGRSVKLNLIGTFFNFIFPSSIGGDLVRGYYLAQDFPEYKMKSALTVVFDRVIGLYSMVTVSMLSLVWLSYTREIETMRVLFWTTLFLFVGYSICLFILASGWGKRILLKVNISILKKPISFLLSCHDYLRDCARNPYLFAKTFFIGVIAQILVVVLFYVVAVFMNETEVGFLDLLSVTPLGFLAMSIPISPAGIGVGQVAFLFLIQQVTGKTTDFGPTAISAFQISLLFWSLVGGWFYLTLKKPKELEE